MLRTHLENRSAAAFWLKWVAACHLLLLFTGSAAWSQYRFTQWTADSGLPQNSVRGLVQTPDGFLWVATLNGVARFDGVRFQVFDKGNTPGISSSRFVAMVRGVGSDLWLASEDGNVVRLHDGRFITLGSATGLRPHSVSAITAGENGEIWVDSDTKVLHWNAGGQKFERESFSTDDLSFAAFWWGTGFWARRDSQIVFFERGRLHTVPLPPEIKPAMIRGVAFGADAALWVGTLDGRMARLYNNAYRIQSDSFSTPMLKPAGQDWTAEITSSFARKVHFPFEGGDYSISYNVLVPDNEGNVWVGSEGEGLFRIQPQFIRSLYKTDGLPSNNVYPILHSANGDMWVGSWPTGVSQVHHGKVVRTFGKADGLPGLVASLAEDRNGSLWIGTHGGVRVVEGGRLIDPKLPLSDARLVAQAIYQAPDGAMLLGTPHGLYIVSGSTSRHMTSEDGLASDDVRVIITDRHRDLWVGGYGGLTRMHEGKLTRWTEAEGLPSNNIRCIVEDASGDIWVGSYDGGIGWLRNGHWVIFNKQRGLFDNGAFQMLEDQSRHFWISSNRGLYRVDRDQLEAVADGREKLVTSIAYGRADGMLSAECNGGLWPAGAKDGQGAFWFPTQMGVAIVDVDKVRTVRQPPKVVIESATVEHKPQDEINDAVLKPGQTNLEIAYTALSYTKPEQITFRYKLQGVDENWQEVGTRRTAYYTHLPPGEYVFHVAAQNSDGVPSQQDALLQVTVVPTFYQRRWFTLLVAALGAVLLWTFWNYRITQLHKAQARQQNFSRELIASQENERRRIAAELHDSLGQRLIIINNLALFLLRTKGKIRTEQDKQQTMEEISAEASAAIEETRAISYALRPFQLDRLGLTRAIQALCTMISRASEIVVRTDLADIDDAFPEELRINVYRIVQEALNNVVKHSGATSADVTARRSGGTVTITVSDNGHGLSSERRIIMPGQGGFGMTGMQERATLLRGSLNIRSDAEAGTLLTIQLPVASERPA